MRKNQGSEFVEKSQPCLLQKKKCKQAEEVGVSTTSLDGISVAAKTTSEPLELKIRIDVTGAKTQEIFDDVFSKMVAAAQPIPGFRRVKGGKTPNIPKDILVQVLGPEKVYKNVIKRVINSSIADYVEKEGLKITKELSVEQNYEELEAKFEPDSDEKHKDRTYDLEEQTHIDGPLPCTLCGEN
ncbi:uncharacterized protein LOC113317561 isoform X2 [Papaver somniferum]|uniref:uncharacterized protein LOC113317561 isoform X2 n=1 Tax=Papaver somniferum TaxID=3469 RepID=UPI000E700011|nr:uncharacterized protein LOC113317561 isoform X2 [Papaver somniferum]